MKYWFHKNKNAPSKRIILQFHRLVFFASFEPGPFEVETQEIENYSNLWLQFEQKSRQFSVPFVDGPKLSDFKVECM